MTVGIDEQREHYTLEDVLEWVYTDVGFLDKRIREVPASSLVDNAGRLRRRLLPSGWTANRKRRAAVVWRDGPGCAYCGDVGSELDHVIPRAKGGHSRLSNLVWACSHCNAQKGSKSLAEYSLWRLAKT